MIGGLVEHDGAPGLAVHLGKVGENEEVLIHTHGLTSDTIADAIEELRLMTIGCRTARPLVHAWASPGVTYSEADWAAYRATFEREFHLEGQPCLEVIHHKFSKGGRVVEHRHFVTLRVDLEGRAISVGHAGPRQEKVSRITEHVVGEAFTSGVFNTSVIVRLRAEGFEDIAEAMERAGLGERSAAPAAASSERAMAERLQDLAPDEVWRRAYEAFNCADSATAFRAALADSGLRLAMGDSCLVVVTGAGAIYPLLRAINKGEAGRRGRLRKAELDRLIDGLDLPRAADLRPTAEEVPELFQITGLERQPAPGFADLDASDFDTSYDSSVYPDPTAMPAPTPTALTPEQEAALTEMDYMLFRGAADLARQRREETDRQIAAELAARTADQKPEPPERAEGSKSLRKKLRQERKLRRLPAIGVADWRDQYRAHLANLPAEYGSRLRWVQKLDDGRTFVILRTDVRLVLGPTRAHADRAAPETVDPMIAHAVQQKWRAITISGGTRAWRERMARAAVRAGIPVLDAELQAVATEERARLDHKRWQDTRPRQTRPEIDLEEHDLDDWATGPPAM